MTWWKDFLDDWSARASGGDPSSALERIAEDRGVKVVCTSSARVRVLEHEGYSPLVVKWWDPDNRHVHEACHLKWLKDSSDIGAPKLVWPTDPSKDSRVGWFLFAMEHVAGQRLDELIEQDPSQRAPLLRQAIEKLVSSHALRHPSPREVYFGQSLTNRLRADLPNIQCAVQSRYSALAQALGEVDTRTVASELSCESQVVLGHGDYKPNNLMLVDDGSLRPLDWVDMGKATPWYDLAYLLRGVAKGLKAELVDHYLQQIQPRSLLESVSFKEAQRGMRYGRVAQLITSTASGGPSTRPGLTDRCREIAEARQATEE